MDYYRLPGFGSVERGDAVVFNFPEGDTIVIDMENPSYYQWVRQTRGGVNTVLARKRVGIRTADGSYAEIPVQGIRTRPLDKRENYIKRCVGLSGDSIEVREGQVFVNSALYPLAETGQFNYWMTSKPQLSEKKMKEDWDINKADFKLSRDRGIAPPNYVLPVTQRDYEQFSEQPMIKSIVGTMEPKHPGADEAYPIFPNDPAYAWSRDNFGPIWIPKEGATTQLTLANLPLYRRAITAYEHNELEVRDGKIFINGAEATSYTFKQNYYWMMGDNRHGSQDSRYWGFVPEDHVVGKAVFIWWSSDPEVEGLIDGVRWKRIFSLVD
ncbi:MAG: signal peptidase I [Flavobacteriales bacterium]|nr:MAG: signal peptidase I [Flavobacteriales bacterium]